MLALLALTGVLCLPSCSTCAALSFLMTEANPVLVSLAFLCKLGEHATATPSYFTSPASCLWADHTRPLCSVPKLLVTRSLSSLCPIFFLYPSCEHYFCSVHAAVLNGYLLYLCGHLSPSPTPHCLCLQHTVGAQEKSILDLKLGNASVRH